MEFSRCLVNVRNSQKDLPLSIKGVKKSVRALLAHIDVFSGEIDIHFVSKKKISRLHKQYFDDESTTDTISFPLDKTHLGIVFVCPAVAIDYAKTHKVDAYSEATLYLVHGILHLLGYDDLSSALRRTMRRKEKNCLEVLKKQKLLLQEGD